MKPLGAVDSHIHLFDPSRPGGVPWPSKENTVLYRPALPDRFAGIAKLHGVAGAIAVECSPLVEDNQWVLDAAAANPIILGMVGNLDPADPEFGGRLDRFRRNPLFLGIRYGNLWGRDLGQALANPEFIAGMKALADAGLTLDSANPTLGLISALLRLSDRVPTLRIVLDHLPQLAPPYGPDLQALAQRPQVYVKVSEVLRREEGKVPLDLAFYRARLDHVCAFFGPGRVLYGSDWPNSDQWAEYPAVFNVVHGYFAAKGPEAMDKYFRTNSRAAYGWRDRG